MADGYPGVGDLVVAAELPVEVFEIAGHGHHSGVVGREGAFGDERFEAVGGAVVSNGLTDTGVGRDTSANSDSGDTCGPDGFIEFVDKDVDYCFLQRGSEVGFVVFDKCGVGFECVAKSVEERGLESGETVVESGNARTREPEACRVAFSGEPVDVGAAGIRESHDLRAFVERFAGGIVDSGTEDLHVVIVADENQLAVSARDEQGEEWVGRDFVVGVAAYEV